MFGNGFLFGFVVHFPRNNVLGIKRRVNVTKVNRFITDEFTQNVGVMTVEKFIHQNIYQIRRKE